MNPKMSNVMLQELTAEISFNAFLFDCQKKAGKCPIRHEEEG